MIYYLNQETKPPRPVITQKKPVIKPILPITNPKKPNIPPTNSPSPPRSPIINFLPNISIPDPEFIHCPAAEVFYEPAAIETPKFPALKPINAPTDYGWLTDDNLEFILTNHPRIQEALTKQKQFTLRTDIANIYNCFYKAQNNQDWDLPEFLQELEWNKAEYVLFPLRVSGNHWGLFILQNLTFGEECSNYQVYYTSSGWGIESEVKQLKPFISQITELENNIQILQGDKQKDGYNCGVYLVFYILELLETGQLELKRKYTSSDCQNFRWEWKQKIGGEKWCKWD
ncbi:hypothetical protein GvMRE_I2g240 [endosymbiont GvMRE of Glomus versiforme]|nr:hypothetical protein GvMRE_I2g240 [endosymbiont GvMRE of Glomus versiforme]